MEHHIVLDKHFLSSKCHSLNKTIQNKSYLFPQICHFMENEEKEKFIFTDIKNISGECQTINLLAKA